MRLAPIPPPPTRWNRFRLLLPVVAWVAGFLAAQVSAQVSTNGFAWVQTGGGPLIEFGLGVTVDPATNAVVVGTFSNSVVFAGATLTNAGLSDLVVAKYAPDGTAVWGRRLGGAQEDGPGGVAADAQGNIYVTGYFKGGVAFGATTLQTRGAPSTSDAFLCKYDAAGNLLWTQQGGGVNDDRGWAVTVDAEGNAIAVGTYQGTATFGTGTQLVGAANLLPETYVAKYSPAGGLLWARRFASSRGVVGYAVATDLPGNVYLTGEFVGAGSFGTNTLSSTGDRDAFVVALSASGETLWSDHLGGALADGGRGIGVDASGGVVVAGYFSDLVKFGSTTVQSAGKKDLFVARYSPAGVLLWTRVGGGNLDDLATGVAVTPQGQAYVSGFFTTTLTLGSVVLPSAGNADAWLARFGIDGTLQWITRAGGAGTVADAANGVAVGPGGSVFLVGQTGGAADFGTNSLTVSGAGNLDWFLARRSTRPVSIALYPTNTSAVIGGTASFGVTAATNSGALLYQWYKDGVLLPGETNALLVLASVSTASAGGYQVDVDNTETVLRTPAAALEVRCKLTVTIAGNGKVAFDPEAPDYALGSQVQMLGKPGPDAFFAGWLGDLTTSDNPAALTMDGNKQVTLLLGSRLLSLGVVGSGTVTPVPDLPLYDPGTPVLLTATPGRYFSFLSWSDGETANPRGIEVGVTNRYVALFTNTLPLETITIGGVSRTAPVGTPQLLIGGEFVPSGPVVRGESADLQLKTSWKEAILIYSLDGGAPNRTYEGPIHVTSNVVVRAAAFSADFLESVAMDTIELQVVPFFRLQVSTPGGGALATAPLASRYLSNQVVTLTATPTNGWSFLGWSGDFSGTNPVASVPMDRNRCIEAIFGTPLAVTPVGAGTVELSPSLPAYPYGAQVRLLSVPAAGSNFVAWSGALSGGINPSVVTMLQPTQSVRALFLNGSGGFPVTVRVKGGGNVAVFPRLNAYAAGDTVLLIATPDARQQFLGFSGDLVQATNRINLVVTQAMVIDASFSLSPLLAMTNCFGAGISDLRLQVGCPLGAVVEIDRGETPGPMVPWLQVTNLLGRVWVTDPGATDHGNGFYQGRRIP